MTIVNFNDPGVVQRKLSKETLDRLNNYIKNKKQVRKKIVKKNIKYQKKIILRIIINPKFSKKKKKRNRNAHSEKLSTHFDPVRCTIFTVHLFDKSLRYTSFYFFSRHYNVRYGHKLLKGTLQSSSKILTWHMTKHNKNQSIQSSSFNLT